MTRQADNNENMDSLSGKVDHSTAGAQQINNLHDGLGKLAAYAVAGHHAGLPDGRSSGSCLESRLVKTIPSIILDPSISSELFGRKLDLPGLQSNKSVDVAFGLSFFVRMLFSCLVDADYLDTESFVDKEKHVRRGGYPSISEMFSKLESHMRDLVSKADKTQVNELRSKILGQCLAFAEQAPGLFSLTVPTGGGKTLSSISFALKHALKHGLHRVIYVIPYTSIIEQNAEVFRNIFGDSVVLEHHSNFDPEESDYRSALASENWDAPLIVTTNVQFFESLFGNRSSQCRKLHNIANSVVILDEAQMLPAHLLKPCLAAIKELSRAYKTTVVLCTATQPALDRTAEFVDGLSDVKEIVPDPEYLRDSMKRCEVEFLGKMSDESIARALEESFQVLCVVNVRRHARELYERITKTGHEYHLSGLMCPAHRTEVLNRVRSELLQKNPCRVISTQLIEAGVDVDFPAVYRSMCGLDSVAQAAGRCNREGRLSRLGKVFVFEPEQGLAPGAFRRNAEITSSVIGRNSDYLSLSSIKDYFSELIWRQGRELDSHDIMAVLAEGIGKLNIPFKRVKELFRVIESSQEPIIIPWNDEAKDIIERLRYEKYPGGLLRQAQKYTVQLFPQIIAKLAGVALERLQDKYYILTNEDIYSQEIGLNYDEPTFRKVEGTIV